MPSPRQKFMSIVSEVVTNRKLLRSRIESGLMAGFPEGELSSPHCW